MQQQQGYDGLTYSRHEVAIMPLLPFFLLVFALTPAVALAGPLSITTNSSTAQTVGAGSSKSGTLAAGASLKVTGATAALTLSGNGATFSNFGTLAQDGVGNAILATGGAGLVINNGSRTNTAALIQATDSETIQAKKSVSGITINNYGTVESLNVSNDGGQAIDFGKVTGANTVNNHAGGTVRATDADAVRPGKQGVVVNAGKLATIKKSSIKGFGAIDAQFNTGIRVSNARGGLIDGARHGITGGSNSDPGAFSMYVTNEPGAIIRGNDGAGLNFDGLGAGQVITVVNDGTIQGTGVHGDGDGIDVDGMVDIVNTGTIRSADASGKPGETPYSEALSVGGGTIINSGIIEGLAPGAGVVGRGIALVGIDIEGTKEREGIYGNTRVENRAGGMIRGSNESAIVARGRANDFTIAIDNQAGATILGGGTAEAAIHSTSNRTHLVNAGTIDGAASGKAIAFAHAGNTLTVKGGSAVIKGAIDGGAGGDNTMVVDAGAGQQFAYTGAIAHFDTLNVKSGNARLSGQLGFKNKTVVSGGSLTLVGPQPIAPGSALVLAGGVLNVAETGPAGQSFASLSLEGNAAIETGRAVLSFDRVGKVVPGKTLKLSGPLRIVGDRGRDAAFLALVRATRIKDGPAIASFDGRYTNLAPASPRTRLARVDKR
jgi:hypothetical protein